MDADTIKQEDMKKKMLWNRVYQENEENDSKLNENNPNLIKHQELKQMDQRTRELKTMHKALHAWDKVDKLYVLRKEGEKGVASIEDIVDASKQRLEDLIKKVERNTNYSE